ncbi:unnamed protein product, partial [Musa banksii]
RNKKKKITLFSYTNLLFLYTPQLYLLCNPLWTNQLSPRRELKGEANPSPQSCLLLGERESACVCEREREREREKKEEDVGKDATMLPKAFATAGEVDAYHDRGCLDSGRLLCSSNPVGARRSDQMRLQSLRLHAETAASASASASEVARTVLSSAATGAVSLHSRHAR